MTGSATPAKALLRLLDVGGHEEGSLISRKEPSSLGQSSRKSEDKGLVQSAPSWI
ncbi:hypothetical protein PGT21_036445 [Puccinia graminis f. sp. tritici]|uniref:Uncharacterized protein n=1 Tax=Puccinia graminis f. sp. tritici TaxID=56615 RepID=A0A5B0R3T1_PUCGR|nr:hypothetical protein PGT21_036445 [Puccinia graminis f. sp. tritici]